MVVIIDNYDSFTYNLAHLVKELGAKVDVLRNDQFKIEELEQYDKIILSPGPGVPEEAGLLLDVIRTYSGKKTHIGRLSGRTSYRAGLWRTVSQPQQSVSWRTNRHTTDRAGLYFPGTARKNSRRTLSLLGSRYGKLS